MTHEMLRDHKELLICKGNLTSIPKFSSLYGAYKYKKEKKCKKSSINFTLQFLLSIHTARKASLPHIFHYFPTSNAHINE